MHAMTKQLSEIDVPAEPVVVNQNGTVPRSSKMRNIFGLLACLLVILFFAGMFLAIIFCVKEGLQLFVPLAKVH